MIKQVYQQLPAQFDGRDSSGESVFKANLVNLGQVEGSNDDECWRKARLLTRRPVLGPPLSLEKR